MLADAVTAAVSDDAGEDRVSDVPAVRPVEAPTGRSVDLPATRRSAVRCGAGPSVRLRACDEPVCDCDEPVRDCDEPAESVGGPEPAEIAVEAVDRQDMAAIGTADEAAVAMTVEPEPVPMDEAAAATIDTDLSEGVVAEDAESDLLPVGEPVVRSISESEVDTVEIDTAALGLASLGQPVVGLAADPESMDQSAVEQPAVEQPAVEQSAVEQSAVEQSVVEPAADAPSLMSRIAAEPVALDAMSTDTFVTLIRLPMGLVAALALLLFWLPVELGRGILAFPYHAATKSRKQIRRLYKHWPHETLESLSAVLDWTLSDVAAESR